MIEELSSDSKTPETLNKLDEIINSLILQATAKTIPKVPKKQKPKH